MTLVRSLVRPLVRPLVRRLIDAGYGSAFSPASLFAAGEQGVWYDPSDFSTMFQDSAGTTPVTAVGQPVGKINDKSGRGNHATQATAAARPVLQQDGAGKYYLAFDGVDDSLATASIDFSATAKLSLFTGIRRDVNATNIIAELSTDFNTFNAFIFYGDTGNTLKFSTRSTSSGAYSQRDITDSAVPSLSVLSYTSDRTLAVNETTSRRNGVVTGTYGFNSDLSGNYGNYPLYIGARAGTSFPFLGRIYSFIVRGADSSAGEINNAEAYVNGKTGAF